MWLNKNPFKKTLQDSLQVRHEISDQSDRSDSHETDRFTESPIVLTEPAPEEYPSDETIFQAFSELTAPAAPELPDIPLKKIGRAHV